MLDMAPFTTWFYYVTPENQLCFGPLYPLMLACLDAIMVLNLVGVIHWRNRLSQRCYIAFLVGLLPMMIATCIHFFASVFELLVIGIVISALSMFGIILSDQIEQNLRQQREIAHQRASIMVLQMRPHFIYNTMMSIYYLCKQDSDLAQQVTLDFTTYLRKNFTAIASEEPIPFREELEHTRAYLAVEQAQFEDSLFIDYDTPHVDFRVPPLTLQPIVENAINHGLRNSGRPDRLLTISLQVTSGEAVFCISDNGVGIPDDILATLKAHESSGIGLSNIDKRLRLCFGEEYGLNIESTVGSGTSVTVRIPEKRPSHSPA